MEDVILFHGSGELVEFPEVRKTKYTKDFSWGFYCTNNYEQACRWAKRNKEKALVNHYVYKENQNLKIKKFSTTNDEWLNFVAECRSGKIHDFDIVEGPMADDTIWNYVNDYINGDINKEQFWNLAKFKYPTHQISFHTLSALNCLEYKESEDLYASK